MAQAVHAVLTAGPEDVNYPRFWVGSTVNARGRVLLDNGDTVQGAGVSFLFRLVADRSVQIELAGLWDAAAKLWRCGAQLDRAGAWEVRLLCLSPQRQTDWLPIEVVDTPGAGNAPAGGLWVGQQGQALVAMNGAGLTGTRIAELQEATDATGVRLPGVDAQGADVGVPVALLRQDAAAAGAASGTVSGAVAGQDAGADAGAAAAKPFADDAASSAIAARLAAAAAEAASGAVGDAALPVATYAQLITVTGTTEGQPAEVYADPPAPAVANLDGSNRNGRYRWIGGAWRYDGQTTRSLEAMLGGSTADPSLAHSWSDRYGALVGWLLTSGVLTMPQVQALDRVGVPGLVMRAASDGATLESGSIELLKALAGGLRLAGTLALSAGQDGYVLGLQGRYGALDWLLHEDGTTSEGRANALASAAAEAKAIIAQQAAAALSELVASSPSSEAARILGRYDEMVASFDGAGVLAGGGLRMLGGAEIVPASRADYDVALQGRYGEINRAWLPDGREAAPDISVAPATTFSATEIAAEHNRALGVRAALMDRPVLEVQAPVYDINIIIAAGQSLKKMQEAWGGKLLSAAEIAALAPGLMMLGDSEHPQTSTTSFPPFGGANVLKPLAGTVVSANLNTLLSEAQVAALAPGDAARGESNTIAAAIIARRMYLDAQGVADDGRQWVVLNCAVSGRTIEQLSYGASPNLFGIIEDGVARVKAIADAAGKTCGVIWVDFDQGQYNYNPIYGGTQDQATFLGFLGQYRADIYQRACVAICNQTRQPLWTVSQTAGGWVRDAALMSISNAQRDFAAAHPGQVVLVQAPYQTTDKGNGHFDLMGSRWSGCAIGRVAGRVFGSRRSQVTVEPVDVALRRGREVLVPMLAPWPQLVWDIPYSSTTAQPSIAQRGFELVDDLGQVPLAADLPAGLVLRLKATRDFVGPVWVQAATQAKGGMTNLFDADPTTYPLTYTYTPGSGQYDGANIPALVGKPFPARTPCAAFRLLTTPA